MSKKKGNFVEQHLDKLILALIGVICLGLLWLYIFRNPGGPQIDGRKESLGSLQSRLEQKKDRLREKMDGLQSSSPVSAPEFVSEFEKMLVCSIPRIDVSVYPLTPGIGSQPIESDREYAVPEIPALQDVKIAYIRGAAYLPAEEVTPELPYPSVQPKIGDLDFVTVSARLDVKRLVQQFQSSFMGLGVKSSHKDPVLATPVAARVELQRRVQMADGSWSSWEVVSIPQTVAYRKTFEKLPSSVDQLAGGGIHVQIAQYKDLIKQTQLLQPLPYDFASSRYQYWMAPQYLDESQKLIQQQKDEARRLLKEAAAAGAGGRETMDPMMGGERGGRPARPTPQRPGRPETQRGRDQRMGGEMGGEAGPGGIATDRLGRPLARQRTMEDVYRDFQKELITGEWWTQNEPLLIWAHDDTVQPGKTYEYRIRAGLFNPIAGRDWFREDQQEYKNQVVLWSPFAQFAQKESSAEPESLTAVVPKMLHIFPMDIPKNNPEAVSVRVSKYYYGQWRSEDFEVLPGQVIGSVVEPKEPAAGTNPAETGVGMEGMPMPGMMGPAMRGMGTMGMGETAVSQTAMTAIDYTTNCLYVDILEEVDWSGNLSALRRKEYNNMLYTIDGTGLSKLPIRQQNWPADLKKDYRDVQEAERESEGETLVQRTPQPSLMQMQGTPGMPPIGPGRGMPPMGVFPGRDG